MAAELITPTDPDTGLPYLIAPDNYYLPLNNGEIANKHHPWHPHDDPFFATVEGQAIRVSMLQLTETRLHNFGAAAYHNFYKGPQLPQGVSDSFGRCILPCAGVLPCGVIDLTRGEPVERPMTAREFEYFRTESPNDEFGYRYVRYGYNQIRDFLIDFITLHGIERASMIDVEEFLATESWERKREIGMVLLGTAIEGAAEPLRRQYASLRRNQQLHPRMPSELDTLVAYKIGRNPDEQLDRFLPRVETQLLEAA